MSFTGGKLKLKGGAVSKPASGKKNKRKKTKELDVNKEIVKQSEELAPGDDPVELQEGYVLPPKGSLDDRRTDAERRYEEKMRKREEERVSKLAAKSHRERVKDFNEYLANLTEHHDIPKVGPG